ncbi:hypothetical protein [Rathayibacter festucae]|uniref:hypothetical protein n=1 Tax=Rathayibacter festucae TaxID=110937 RepID=UPI002A6B24B9|nr:hypothetical protein [Rathayibacter festucae]MDY0912302.1 hypothetical protein [Rathayibacter festucae]
MVQLTKGDLMKRVIVITASILGLSIAALLLVIAYVSVGRSFGQKWSSLDGPEPVWPAVVGFGSMNLAALSGATLAVLVLVFVGRELSRGRNAKSRR